MNKIYGWKAVARMCLWTMQTPEVDISNIHVVTPAKAVPSGIPYGRIHYCYIINGYPLSRV